jgi:hypothetical protein
MSLRTKAAKTDAKKLTAAQIKKSAGKPRQRGTIGELHDIGRQIQAKVEILNRLGGKAVDMKDSIDHLLADAEKLCDQGGFEAFKKCYCQGLGQSRTYELLAIQQGRKTVEDIRAATRRRVAEHRAAKRNVTESDSVTSDETANPELECLEHARDHYAPWRAVVCVVSSECVGEAAPKKGREPTFPCLLENLWRTSDHWHSHRALFHEQDALLIPGDELEKGR